MPRQPLGDLAPLNDPNPFAQGTDGSVIRAGYAWPVFFQILPGEEVNTLRLGFYATPGLSTEVVKVGLEAAGLLDPGEQFAAFILYEKSEPDFVVPGEWCFDVPFLGHHCFPLPFAGSKIDLVSEYGLFIIARQAQAAGMSLVRQDIRPLGIVAGAVILLSLLSMFYIFEVLTGKATMDDVTRNIRSLFAAPGDAFTGPIQSLAVPLMAFGLVLVVGGLFLPGLAASATASVPIGGGNIGATLGSSGRATPPPSGQSDYERQQQSLELERRRIANQREYERLEAERAQRERAARAS